MASNSPLAYPAEYYYPEFIDSRPDDPLKSPPTSKYPLSSAIDNGVGSSTRNDYTNPTTITTTTTAPKPITKKQTTPSLAVDVVTDHGLPDTDITQTVKTDPKKNLIRNPAERNIPRLIVDDSVIKQTVRTPKIVLTTNLDDDYEKTKKTNQINNDKKSIPNGNINTDLTNKTKSQELLQYQQQYEQQYQPIKYVDDGQQVDDYWKKQVLIDDEGAVTIEPLKYDKDTYDGPFGLTRTGSLIFYIGMAVLTVLAAVFLIMTGIFYGQSYPDSSGNTAKLAGIGVCAFAFYCGLLLILIGLWHQKYRQENPTQIIKKPNKHNESSAHLKSSMEENLPYDYSYQQQYDYTPYENYPYPPYTSNTNEQMLLQQPGAATGAAYYDPVVWPSNVEITAQPDPKFHQPMEWSLGTQSMNDIPPNNNMQPMTAYPPPVPVIITETKPKKKHDRHHNKKTIESEPPKPKFDNLFPNSTATEKPLPVLPKAPETTELIQTIAEMEKNNKRNSNASVVTRTNSNRIQPSDGRIDNSSHNGREHYYGDRDRDHHNQHHSRRRYRHRRHSCSSCSTCSSDSRDAFHSDVGYHQRRHYQHQYSEPGDKIITARSHRSRTPSPPRTYRSTHHSTAPGTQRTTRDTGITTGLEDVPNVRDNRLEQIPVVRRTIIVEPYPAEPTTQITIKPNTTTTRKIRVGKNEKSTGDKKTSVYPTSLYANTSPNKKKNPTENNGNIMEDLRLEDVNDDHTFNFDESTKSKKKKTNKTSSSKSAKNAFYD